MFRLAVATASGSAASLYPATTAAEIDDLLDLAHEIDTHAAAWLQPTCAAASAEDRTAAKAELEKLLHVLDTRINDSNHLVGGAVTLADIAVASSVLRLYQDVLGQDVQQAYPCLTRWLTEVLRHDHFDAILGE